MNEENKNEAFVTEQGNWVTCRAGEEIVSFLSEEWNTQEEKKNEALRQQQENDWEVMYNTSREKGKRMSDEDKWALHMYHLDLHNGHLQDEKKKDETLPPWNTSVYVDGDPIDYELIYDSKDLAWDYVRADMENASYVEEEIEGMKYKLPNIYTKDGAKDKEIASVFGDAKILARCGEGSIDKIRKEIASMKHSLGILKYNIEQIETLLGNIDDYSI